MLRKLKLQTLKQKLWAIIAASFVARVIMFFVLPNTPSSLAPDEGTYASITKWIGQSKPADDFPAYGQGLYLSGRSIIIPASLLYRVGFNELDAVRLVSTTYGLIALILVVTLILKLYKQNMTDLFHQNFNSHLIVGLVLIFAFLPSHFTWSNLGLRESATEFWILATFGIFFMLYHVQKKITALGISALATSIAFTFSSRPQVGWVIGLTLVAYLLFKFDQVLTYFVIGVVLCGVLLGIILNQGSVTENKPTTSSLELTSSLSTLGDLFDPLTNAGELINSKHLGNQLDAASVIKTQSCPRQTPSLSSTPSTKFDTYFCIAWRAPYMISIFLIRPFVGVDVTSTSSLIAALENLIWMTLFALILFLITKYRHISFLSSLLPSIVFFVFYVSGASAYQGNMGTGFRHKSLILWVVLLMIFALVWRKTESPGLNSRNNSQENAV
jgi:hypothetical protein